MRVDNLYLLYYLKNRDIKEEKTETLRTQNKTQRFFMKAFADIVNLYQRR